MATTVPDTPQPRPAPSDPIASGGGAKASFAALFVAVLALGWAVAGMAVAVFRDDPAGVTTAAGGSSAAVPAASLTLQEFKISPAAVTAAAGSVVSVTNLGNVEHDVQVQGTEHTSGLIPAGGTGKLDLTGVEPGTYTLICTVAGHEASGMRATLTVVAAPAASASQASHGGSTATTMSAEAMDEQMAVNTKKFLAGVTTKGGPGGVALAPKVLPDGTKRFELTSSIVDWEVEPGKLVKAWTYNGTVPGPTIKVNPGDKVQVALTNKLPESTAIHFHGLTTPNTVDGVPDITQAPIKPGETFTYSFTAQPEPMIGMYHSHHNAVAQVPNGLAALFQIGDLPLPDGVKVSQELPMVVNDSGTIGYAINGKGFPATAPLAAKQGEWILVHYLNEGQQIHPMHLHGMEQVIIAKDGHPLATPVTEDTVTVAPGERYSVLVHATVPGAWAWHCHILSHAENDKGMFGMVTALVVK